MSGHATHEYVEEKPHTAIETIQADVGRGPISAAYSFTTPRSTLVPVASEMALTALLNASEAILSFW